MATPEVIPKAGAPAPTEQPQAKAGALPDDLLNQPFMQGLLSGQPAAISAVIADMAKRPEGKLIAANKDGLTKMGMGFYRDLTGGLGVVFNQAYISGQEIQEADKAGQLAQVAPGFDEVNASVAQSGQNNPVLNAQTPAGFRTAPVPQAPQSGSPIPTVQPPAAGAQRKTAQARAMNMKPQGPTEGSAPASGQLLRSILRPVV